MFDKIKRAMANKELRDITLRALCVGMLVLAVIGVTYLNRAANSQNELLSANEYSDGAMEQGEFMAVIDLDPPDEMEPERDATLMEKAAKEQDETADINTYAVFNEAMPDLDESAVLSVEDAACDAIAEDNENGVDMEENAVETWGKPLVLQMPADGTWQRTFGYGYDKSWDDYRFHNGCDMSLPVGSNVYAACDGKVSEIYNDELWGNVLVVKHRKNTETVYKGIAPKDNLAVGDQIKAGDVLGQVVAPSLAEDLLDSHLHFEVWVDGKMQDPGEYIK